MAVGYNLYGNPEESLYTDAGQNAAKAGITDAGGYAMAAGTILSGVGDIMNGVAQANSAKKQAEADIKRAEQNIYYTNIARSSATSNLLHGARDRIDTSRAAMAAMGNIGSSADAAVVQAYKNLDSNLSSIKFNYDVQETNYINEKNLAEWKKKQAKKARSSSIFGGVGKVIGSAIGAAVGTFICPGVGTALGAQLGGSVGSIGGQMAYNVS